MSNLQQITAFKDSDTTLEKSLNRQGLKTKDILKQKLICVFKLEVESTIVQCASQLIRIDRGLGEPGEQGSP